MTPALAFLAGAVLGMVATAIACFPKRVGPDLTEQEVAAARHEAAVRMELVGLASAAWLGWAEANAGAAREAILREALQARTAEAEKLANQIQLRDRESDALLRRLDEAEERLELAEERLLLEQAQASAVMDPRAA